MYKQKEDKYAFLIILAFGHKKVNASLVSADINILPLKMDHT